MNARRQRARALAGLAAPALMALAGASPASAFVESASSGDLRLHLDFDEMGCSGPSKITFEIDSDGSADVIPASDGTDAILSAFDSWDAPASGISETSLDLCPSNVLQLGTFDGDEGLELDFPKPLFKIYFAETDTGGTIGSSTIAVSSFFFSPSTGEIVDCDIAFNGDDSRSPSTAAAAHRTSRRSRPTRSVTAWDSATARSRGCAAT